jgi:hypothetical protein
MRSRRDRQGGSIFIEFLLVATFWFIPLILGLLSIGFALTRTLQVVQLTRDVGRMYVRGADFSSQANQDLITGSASRPNPPPLAKGLGMQGNGGNSTGGTSGNGVLVLSTLTAMPNTCGCNNSGHIVLSRRIVIGNKTLFTSSFGAPTAGLISPATGFVSNYSNDVSARADSFSGVINLNPGELAFMVESKFNFPDLAMPAILPNPGVVWRVVF